MNKLTKEKYLKEYHPTLKKILEVYYKNIINDEERPFDSILDYIEPEKLSLFFEKVIQNKDKNLSNNFRELSILLNAEEEEYYTTLLFLFMAESIEDINIRDSLLLYEEIIGVSEEQEQYELKDYAFKKLAFHSIDIKTYNSSKSFYNYVFYNRTRKLDFSCSSHGKCCRTFNVNITPSDINNILLHKPELDVDDFIYYKKGTFFQDYLSDNSKEIKQNSDYQLFLKKKETLDECLFLEDNVCSIHDFKPFTCSNWPNSMNVDKKLSYQHLYFLNDHCKYTVVPNLNNKEEIFNNIRKSDYSFRSFRVNSYELFNELNNQSIPKKNTLTDLINVYLEKEKLELKTLEKIKNIVSNKNKIIKVSVLHNIKKLELEKKKELQIKIICENKSISKVKNDLYKELSSLEIKNVFKKKYSLSVYFQDFPCRIDFFFFEELSLLEKNEVAEKVIYYKENYFFPEIDNEINYILDELVLKKIIESVKMIIKFNITKDNNEVRSSIENIFRLYKLVNNNLNSELSDYEILLIEQFNKQFKKFLKYYFKTVSENKNIEEYYSDYMYFTNNFLDKLKTDKKLFLYIILVNIKYLSKSNLYKNEIEKLIKKYLNLLEDDNYYSADKFLRFLFKTKEKYSNEINKEICLISYSMYDLSFDKGEIEKETIYLEVLIEYYQKGYFELLDEVFPDLIFNFSKLLVLEKNLDKISYLLSSIYSFENKTIKIELLNKIIYQLILSENIDLAIEIYSKIKDEVYDDSLIKEIYLKNSFLLNSLCFNKSNLGFENKYFDKFNQFILTENDFSQQLNNKDKLSFISSYLQRKRVYELEYYLDKIFFTKVQIENEKESLESFKSLLSIIYKTNEYYFKSIEKDIFNNLKENNIEFKSFNIILCNNELSKYEESLKEFEDLSGLDSDFKNLYSFYLKNNLNLPIETMKIKNDIFIDIFNFNLEYIKLTKNISKINLEEEFNESLFFNIIQNNLLENSSIVEMVKFINMFIDALLIDK